jgi:DNA-binding MarR family transcriptional regulator
MSLYTNLKSLLFEAGLSESEVLIYLELLKEPAVSKWELIKRTGLSKNAVYRAFTNLEKNKMIEESRERIKALSLKSLVSELKTSERKFRKLAYKIKSISPFLHTPNDAFDELETLYTPEQIQEAYMFMSEQDYDINFDFGDFENFIKVMGNLDISKKYRQNRIKHASNKSLITTFGPNSAYFCTHEAENQFKSRINLIKADFKGRFIIFSDNNDYVLLNDFTEPEYPSSVLVKSPAVANAQRGLFRTFSQQIEN